ncbi:LysR substrate-binding domain-containing protein [Acidithiobacillus sp. IBUN Pt1247-S3]|uniref:LysR family transcriptional regulator n=1 Tax=Acidithiobacillus sp. IBUN Pt1247-S3 TaxID=3166642 RepID=UPI0034E5A853
MIKLPDLEAWAIFAKVVELGSFAKAAQELGLSQATVSKSITRLEARLKTTLFHRTSRKMSLTESGRVAVERAARIVAEGEAVECEVTAQSTNPRGLIRMAAPMSFGIGHLAPLLPEFMASYPDIALEIDFHDEIVDLIEHRIDVALRISNLADSTLLARRLCAIRVLLVGSPAYLERFGRPEHPRELSRHRALRYANAPQGDAWHFQHQRHGEFGIGIPASLTVNNAEALTPVLLAGLGLALQPEFLVWEQLRDGRLEQVMPEWVAPPIALHILTPPQRARPLRVDLMIDFLARRFANAPWSRPVKPLG